MDAARRVVLLELGMGLLWLGYGFGMTGFAGLRSGWWLAVPAAAGTVALMYAEEHRVADWDPYYRGGLAIALVVGFTAVVGAVGALTALSVVDAIAVAMTGIGAGLLPYRFVYGVVRPVPESRLAAARERAF
ncbi:hypothetical protein [Halosimplex halobium]|uniref:hypothetical protein n=1 Tax=Halosimplex halobium TaxID=3396618 RepID=UPI003F5483F3